MVPCWFLRIRYVMDNSFDIKEMHIRMILAFQFLSIPFLLFFYFYCLENLDVSLGDFSILFLGHTRRLSDITGNHLLQSLISSKNLVDFFLTAEIFWYHFGTHLWSESVFLASLTAFIQCTDNHFSPIQWYQCILVQE